MFGCRSPSRRSARWTTSLQPSILHLFSPNSVTSDSWCNKLCTDAKQPAHAHLRIALPLHFLSFLFSVFMGLQIIQPVLVLSPTLFPSEELDPRWGHIQLLPGDKFSSQHCFSHLSSWIFQLSFSRPCDPLSETMPPQLFVLV